MNRSRGLPLLILFIGFRFMCVQFTYLLVLASQIIRRQGIKHVIQMDQLESRIIYCTFSFPTL